jgi:hypothetical protein
MPTQRTRHMITESAELSESLDQAADHWPDCKSRAELLRLLIEEGSRSLLFNAETVRSKRLDALRSFQELSAGMWPTNFDEQRKSEWDA